MDELKEKNTFFRKTPQIIPLAIYSKLILEVGFLVVFCENSIFFKLFNKLASQSYTDHVQVGDKLLST